jgi:hypothetical protein
MSRLQACSAQREVSGLSLSCRRVSKRGRNARVFLIDAGEGPRSQREGCKGVTGRRQVRTHSTGLRFHHARLAILNREGLQR